MIEKHFTLRRADGGVDSAFSLEPAQLKALVEETDAAWRVSAHPSSIALLKASSAYRRSLYIVAMCSRGHTDAAEPPLDSSGLRAQAQAL